jgi:hypothetical protein
MGARWAQPQEYDSLPPKPQSGHDDRRRRVIANDVSVG